MLILVGDWVRVGNWRGGSVEGVREATDLVWNWDIKELSKALRKNSELDLMILDSDVDAE